MSALAIKLTSLAVKTASKPLARQLESFTMSHPTTRQWLMRMAQRYHGFQVQVTRRAEGKEGKAFVGTITDEKAIETASKLVSETVVFTVAGALVMWEYRKSSEKDQARKEEENKKAREKEAEMAREKEAALSHFQHLGDRISHLERMVEDIRQELVGTTRNRPVWSWFGR